MKQKLILQGIWLGLMMFLSMFKLMAQKTYTLEQCVQQALEKNLQIKQAKLQQDLQKVHFDQTKYNFLPDINTSLNWSRSFGTSFDQITFQRVQRNTSFSSPRANLFWTLFAGFANHYQRKQMYFQEASAGFAVQVTENTVITNVIGTYLLLLFDHENLKVAQKRLESLQKQLEKVKALFEAGLRNGLDVANLEAQIASEQTNILNLQNQIQKDRLTLLQLMEEEDMNAEYVFPPLPKIDIEQPLPSLEQVLQNALKNLPEMRQAEAQIEAQKFAKKLAFTGRIPSISFSAGLGSSYSSNGGKPEFDPITFRYLGMTRTSYFEQVQDNFNQNISLTLSVPIFSRWQNIKNQKLADLNLKNSELQYETTKNNLTKTIQQAYLDVLNTKAKFQALQKQLHYADQAYQMAQEKYLAGNTDFYTFYETFGNKFKLESDLLQAQYEFWLRIKILDLYQGKNIFNEQ